MWETLPDNPEGKTKRQVILSLLAVVAVLILAFVAYGLGGNGSQVEQNAPAPQPAVSQAHVVAPPQPEELLDLSKLTLDRLKELSARGNAEASFEVGERYRLGKGCIRDAEEADRWYDAIIKTADPDMMHKLAGSYLAIGRFSSSTDLYRRAAIWGVRSAQLQLAYLMRNSASDHVETYAWFRVCSSWGDVASAHAVERFEKEDLAGDMISVGRLRERQILIQVELSLDIRKARRPIDVLRKSAAAGDHAAMVELADALYVGQTCVKDETDALSFYKLAADAGYAPAFSRLGHFYQLSSMSSMTFSRIHYLNGAIAGDLFCQRIVALCYLMGTDAFALNKVEAYAWYNILAATGDQEAAQSRDRLESMMKSENVTSGQKRSRELLKEIEANKAKK